MQFPNLWVFRFRLMPGSNHKMLMPRFSQVDFPELWNWMCHVHALGVLVPCRERVIGQGMQLIFHSFSVSRDICTTAGQTKAGNTRRLRRQRLIMSDHVYTCRRCEKDQSRNRGQTFLECGGTLPSTCGAITI